MTNLSIHSSLLSYYYFFFVLRQTEIFANEIGRRKSEKKQAKTIASEKLSWWGCWSLSLSLSLTAKKKKKSFFFRFIFFESKSGNAAILNCEKIKYQITSYHAVVFVLFCVLFFCYKYFSNNSLSSKEIFFFFQLTSFTGSLLSSQQNIYTPSI